MRGEIRWSYDLEGAPRNVSVLGAVDEGVGNPTVAVLQRTAGGRWLFFQGGYSCESIFAWAPWPSPPALPAKGDNS
jgi:hypothetical protein